jgi:hypothetical protein
VLQRVVVSGVPVDRGQLLLGGKMGGSWSKKKSGFFHVAMRKSPLLVGK